MVQHNAVLTRQPLCVHKLFTVDHCIRLRNTMAIIKDRSHINQLRSLLRQYIFFLISSTDQDLHQPSRFRVYVFLLDIFCRIIYWFIYYVKLYQSKAWNSGNAKAVNHHCERAPKCATLNEISTKKRRSMSLVTHLPIPDSSLTASTLHIPCLHMTSSPFPTYARRQSR